jgi:hypothetical protein
MRREGESEKQRIGIGTDDHRKTISDNGTNPLDGKFEQRPSTE